MFIRRTDVLRPEDIALLRAIARVHVVCDGLGLGALLEFPDDEREYAGRPDAVVPPKYARDLPVPRAPEPSPQTPENGYGRFNDAGEYELLLRGTELPPAPWSNVVANPERRLHRHGAGGGCTWAENSFFYRITPWHNDPVRDPCSDCVYLRDDDSGDVWTATPAPIREMSDYVVKHGQRLLGVRASARRRAHVARDGDGDRRSGEDHARSHHQHRQVRPSDSRITGYVEWVLGVSRDLTQQHIRTVVRQDDVLDVRPQLLGSGVRAIASRSCR